MTEFFSSLHPQATTWIRETVFLSVVIVLASIALRLVGNLVHWLAKRLQAPPLALKPLSVAGRMIVFIVVAGALVGHYFDVDIFALLGSIIALIGVGFVAVWSTLSNMLCTLLLLTVRPFRIGDEVELTPENLKGRVVDLNLFFTTLLTADARYVQIPNNFFFQRAIICRRGGDNPAPGDGLASLQSELMTPRQR